MYMTTANSNGAPCQRNERKLTEKKKASWLFISKTIYLKQMKPDLYI